MATANIGADAAVLATTKTPNGAIEPVKFIVDAAEELPLKYILIW